MDRISFDIYCQTIASVVAMRSTCPRLLVGAVITDEKGRIRSTGYNGAPKGKQHCADAGCLLLHGHCKRSVHAEINAILQLQSDASGMTLYCTDLPCYECSKIISQVGLKRICYNRLYKDESCYLFHLYYQDDFLRDSNIVVDQIFPLEVSKNENK